jgi:DNA-binding response OmpR family regulator
MRVLVVEDERGLADDIAEGLRDNGLAVDVAYDGLDGAGKVNLHPYDVVVLDRDLPGLHGDTLCRMITDGEHPAMVLMLTAAGAPGDRVAGLAIGADDYLAKPFHFPELVLRVHALARRRPVASRLLRVGDLQLDPLRRTASRDGAALELSAKEFAVLHELLRASPGSLTAEQLLLQAWDENADPFTRTVYVTIARLKRKLGEPQPIRTTPGLGYSIVAG